MPDIKTRDAVNGTVKVIGKSAVAAERMKDAYVRIRRSTAFLRRNPLPKNTPPTAL